MVNHRVYLVLIIAMIVIVKSEYPRAWATVDPKPVIDNERLYQKYKKCLVTNNTKGCPRLVLQVKAALPEMVETMCAKCSPALISQIKRTVQYICHTRKSDYDQVSQDKDPDAHVRKQFQAKYGKVDC